jgi:hypothetical protein
MPIAHVSVPTGPTHFKEMRAFYITVLKPLGYSIFREEFPNFCGFGTVTGGPDFWIHAGNEDLKSFDGDLETRGGRAHVAFQCASIKDVDLWYKTAM